MFVRNCDKVKKAAGGIQTLFGQRDKGHMWRKSSFCEFLILGEVRVITQHFTTRKQEQEKNYTVKFRNCMVLIADNHELIM
jgi:hypothetical protein